MTEGPTVTQMVVVGSSAGGIEALSTLVQTLPPDLPAAVVIAQHLDPSRESHLGEILSRGSTLPVRKLSDRERLAPGVIYVVPANRDVVISDHDIRLRKASHRSQPSIDRLFASAASAFGEELIAIVLTGTGSDGAAGALEVRQAGGTVVIQDPLTATFPALPRSLPPSVVDFVVPLEEMGKLLQGLLAGTYEPPSEDEDEAFTELLRFLRDRHGVDFRAYKRPTIWRRVQRRLAATGTRTIGEYLNYLRQHGEEQQALIGNLLIKVTKFFRDPDLFSLLRERILPDIIESARDRDRTIRIWSAGCATGEEAYSLAILVAEALGNELDQFHVRIFATDLDADAIAFARQGIYAPNRLSGLDPATLERYFDSVEGGYQIRKQVRSLMVFGQHDLAERAPFPRVDLILCRNVLIYFTGELQRRILQLFAFALRDGGYLILGKSETTSSFPEPFSREDTRLKAYRRKEGRPVLPQRPFLEVPLTAPQTAYGRPSPRAQPIAYGQHQAQPVRTDRVLLDLPVGVVVVDQRYDVQYINDCARSLLNIRVAALGDDLIHLVQPAAGADLRRLIDRAFAGEEFVAGSLNVSDAASQATRDVEILCTLEGEGEESQKRVTVCLLDVTSEAQHRQRLEEELHGGNEARERAEKREGDLLATNRELLRTNQQLTRELAELRSQNEEFLVGNEELQSATEEVETLNEELQATNEELETLNEELQATVEELNTTNDDLQTRNLEIQDLAIRLEGSRARLQTVLNTLPEAIVVVDRAGRPSVTNSTYERLFDGDLEHAKLLDENGKALKDGERPHERAARGEGFQMQFSLKRDGTLQTYDVTAAPIGDGETARSVVVIRETDGD